MTDQLEEMQSLEPHVLAIYVPEVKKTTIH